jgi:hypothetical protein
MDVEVDDEHARAVLALHETRRDGDVVQRAVPLARIAHGMMGAAGEIGREPCARPVRSLGGVDGALHGEARAAHEPRGPLHADPSLLVGRQRAVAQLGEIGLVVGEGEHLPRSLLRLALVPRAEQPLARERRVQELVLPHRKGVTFRQRNHVVGVIGDVFHGHGSRGTSTPRAVKGASRARPRTPSCRTARRDRA